VSRQLILDLPVRTARGRGDFFVSPANAVALAAVEAPWPAGRLLLTGPEGSGKTHLAALWQADRPGTDWCDGAALARADIPALAAAGAVVDAAEAVAGDPAAEAALFHLVNLAAAEGAPLLLTARKPARDWGVTLPDLQSRIQATPVAALSAPDDALLFAVLGKLFADRQVAVGPEVLGWLVARIERSLAEAGRVVAALDAEALAQRRAITVRLAGRVLDRAG
jgi:chromosomal replication initiation ATPase DnaA